MLKKFKVKIENTIPISDRDIANDHSLSLRCLLRHAREKAADTLRPKAA